MRILIAHSFYRIPGGEDRYVEQQRRLLSQRHDVELLSLSNTDLRPGLMTAGRMIFSRRRLNEIDSMMQRFAPDVVHLHNAYPAIGPAVHLAAHARHVPLVQTIHNLRLRCPNGVMFTEGQPCHRCETGNYANAVLHHCLPTRAQSGAYAISLWSHRYLLKLHRLVDTFVAPSRFMEQRLQSWGFPAQKIVVIRNFVDLPVEHPADVGTNGVFVGRLSTEKGLITLIHALRLADDPPFHIVGDGPLRNELEALARELGLRHVEFTGRVAPANVEDELRTSRYLVMPSECDENAPLAALEAMAWGRPIIVSNRGGLPELAGNGRGLVFEAGDTTALAAHLRSFTLHSELAEALGREARGFVDHNMSQDVHLELLDRLYERLSDRSTREES